jgi:ribosome-binding factor A
MSTHNRPERVAQMVQQLLGEIFARGMRDPRIGFVTITGVKMSPDLREARVYWTVHGDTEQRKQTAKGLDNARGFLRRAMGGELTLRVVPELQFTYDEAIDRGERIEQLIRQVHDEQHGRREEPPEGPVLAKAEGTSAGDKDS